MKQPPKESRHQVVTRRALLKRSLGAGAVLALPGIAAACGSSTPVATTSPATEPATTQTTAVRAETAPETTADTTAATEAPQTTAASSGGTALPAGGELVVGFTYTMGSGGKDLPPYVAVWIENSDGDLVDTIDLWYQQDEKGTRWLPDLKRWFRKEEAFVAAGNADETQIVSSATRQAGAYSVVWDGVVDSLPVAAGSYFVCIESARERGPYSLIREEIVFNGGPVDAQLADEGELGAASVAVAA